jgi:hypothetical protein
MARSNLLRYRPSNWLWLDDVGRGWVRQSVVLLERRGCVRGIVRVAMSCDHRVNTCTKIFGLELQRGPT